MKAMTHLDDDRLQRDEKCANGRCRDDDAHDRGHCGCDYARDGEQMKDAFHPGSAADHAQSLMIHIKPLRVSK